MKSLKLAALAALFLSGSAIAAQAPVTVTFYRADPVAAAAIQQGDLSHAEAVLSNRWLGAGDPVRLINLGDVYWLSGRQTEAVGAWRQALASSEQYDVVTAGGRTMSTYDIAREALAMHGAPIRTASR
jgi:hypothetical protein